MHSLRNYILILLLFVLFQDQTYAQLCGCTACPVDVAVGATQNINFEITGATMNTDLGGSQSVCGVVLTFDPTNMFGIEMTLTSPAGQSIQLIGPTAVGAGTGITNFDVGFVKCVDSAIPEPGFDAQWNNAQVWPINGTIFGTYYPFDGCLEDFNTGSINGNWTLRVDNNNTSPPTNFPLVLENFYPIFCEEVGIDCNPCDADAGDLSAYPDIQVCEEDPELTMLIDPVYPNGAPDPGSYAYRFTIGDTDDNNRIIAYQPTFDMSSYGPGTYTICGFSILQDDIGNLGPFLPPSGSGGVFPPTSTVTLGELNNFLMGTNPPVCGDLTNNCFEIDIFPIPNNPSIAFPDTIPCSGTQSILLDGSLPPGNPPFTWSAFNGGTFGAGQNTLTPEVLSAGTYVLEIMYPASICIGTDTVEVVADTRIPNISIVTPDLLNCSGPVELNGSGTTGSALSFEWFEVATGLSISMSSTAFAENAGDYLLVATSGLNNCVDSMEIEVFGSSEMPIAIAPTQDTLSCNETSVLLDGGLSTGGTLFDWYNSAGTLMSSNDTLTVFTPDVYELVVTNLLSDCKDTTYTTVVEISETPTAIITPPDTLNCSIDLVTLFGNTSLSTNPVEYCWLNPDGAIIGLSQNHQVSIAGVFQLIVKDQVSGCQDTTDVEVIKLESVPTAVPTPNGILNCQQDTVSVDALSSFGINELTYEWHTAFWDFIDDSDSIQVTNTNFYNLLVIDEVSGCVDSLRFSVMQDTVAPIASAIVNDMISCANETVLLDGAGSSYENSGSLEWFDPLGNNILNAVSYNTSIAGEHLLVATDAINFCTDSLFFEVLGDTSSVIAIAFPDTLNCIQTEVTLDGSASIGPPGIEFEWQNFAGTFLSATATHVVTTPDIYRLIVSLPNSTCADTIEIDIPQIIVQPDISVTTDPGTILDCNITSIYAEAFVIGGFTWHNSDWDTIAQTHDYTITTPGTYYFVGESNSTFCLDTVEIVITDNFNYPNAAAIALDTITCTQDSVILNGSGSSGNGPLAYQWYDPIDLPLGMGATQVAYTSGTYTLVVENTDFGCTDTVDVVVNQVAHVPVAVIDSIGLLDCGSSTLVLDGSNSTSTGPLSYIWRNLADMSIVSMIATANISTAGVYELTIVDQNSNCESTASIAINNTAQPTSTIAFPDTINCGNLSVDLIGAASLGTGMLTYNWLGDFGTPIGMTQDITVTEGGVYTLIVGHELNSCTDTSTIVVIENLIQPVAGGTTNDTLSCYDPIAVMTPLGSSGNGMLEFEWFDPLDGFVGNSALEIAFIPGGYTLIVTDLSNECKDTTTVVVLGNIDPPTAEAGVTGVGCDGDQIFISGLNSTGQGVLDYEWQDTFGFFVSNGIVHEVDSIATYLLIVTDSENGCADTTNITIPPGGLGVTAIATVGEELDCENSTVLLNGSMSIADNMIFYEWYDTANIAFSNNEFVPVSISGVYTLVVFDQLSGCSDTTTVEVVQAANAVNADIQTSGNGVINCEFPTIQLDGTNSTGTNLAYEWKDPAGTSLSTDPIYPASSPNFYWLVITDTLTNCTDSISLIVPRMQDTPEAIALVQDTINCFQSAVLMDGVTSFSATNHAIAFQWYDNLGTPLGSDTIQLATSPGLYNLIVTDTITACSDTTTVEVFQSSDQPNSVITFDNHLSCINGTTTLDGTLSSQGGQWTDDAFSDLGNTPTLPITTPGIYYLILQDNVSMCADTSFVEIFQYLDEPVAAAQVDSEITCVSDTIFLNGNASSTAGSTLLYEWQNGVGITIGNQPNELAFVPDNYTLIVTDSLSGCIDSIQVTPTINNTPPIASALVFDSLSCVLDSVLIAGSSSPQNLDYEWRNAANQVVGSNTNLLVGDPGFYGFLVTDPSNGCSDSLSVEVFSNVGNVIAQVAIPDSLGCGVENVLLDGSSSIGTNLSYVWKDDTGFIIETDAIATVTEIGVYTLVVSDQNMTCADSTTVEVFSGGGSIVAQVATPDSLGCGVENVLLDGNPSIGTNLSYVWKDDTGLTIETDAIATVAEIGVYTLVVSDQNMTCADSTTVEVFSGGGSIVAQVAIPDSLGCGVENVLLDGNPSIGTNLSYVWKDDTGLIIETDAIVTVTEIGIYTLVVSDQNMTCADSTTVEVFSGGGSIVAQVAIPDSLGCGVENVLLDGSPSIGTNLSYVWKDDTGLTIETDAIATVTETGVYTLVVSDQNMTCADSTTVEVFSGGGSIIAQVAIPDSLGCGVENVLLNGSPSIGTNLSYVWKDDTGLTIETDAIATVTETGVYTLVVSDQNMTCTDSTTVEVFSGGGSVQAVAISSGDFDCDTQNITLDSDGSSSNVMYEWKNADGEVESVMSSAIVDTPGSYTLVITSLDGVCVDSTVVVVGTNPGILSPIATVSDTLSCEVGEALLNGVMSSGAVNLVYDWRNDLNVNISNNQSTNVNDPGIYTLYLSSENGVCLDSIDVEVFQDEGSVIANAVVIDTLTCSTLSVNLDASGSTGGNFFEWFDPSGLSFSMSAMASTNQVGIHKLIVSNADQSCIDSTTIEVIGRFEFPTTVVTPFDQLTCADDTILLDATASTGIGTLGYNWLADDWSLLSFDATYEAMAEGIYYAVVSDADTGCADTLQVNVTANFNSPVGTIEVEGGFGCGNNQALLTGSSTINPVNYQWFDQMTNTLIGTSPTQDIFNAGTYYLVVMEPNNGCTDTTYVDVNDSGQSIEAITSVDGTINCNNMSVMISGTGSSAGNEVTYSWYNPMDEFFSNQISETINTGGPYWLVVSNGICADTSYIDVIDESGDLPEAIISGPDTLTINCGDQLILDGSTTIVNDTLIATWSPMSSINTFADAAMLQPIVGTTGWLYLSVLNTNSGCIGVDSLLIQSFQSAVSAGPDTLICGDDFMLNAELPVNNTGQWTLPDDIQMDDLTSPNGIISGMQSGQIYDLVWTISADGCPDYATANVQISIEESPIAVDDDFEFDGGFGPFNFDILENDELIQSIDIYNVISDPTSGSINDNGSGNLDLEFNSLFAGEVSFEYEICNNICPNLCDTALVVIQIDSLNINDITIDIPNAITPNDDGLNDAFIIDFILAEPDKYPDNELIIVNRWGDEVYQAKPYQNNWNGTNKLGLPLPDGTYYYLLRLDLQNGLIYKGDITILR